MGSGVGSAFKDTNLPLRSPRSTIRFEATKAWKFDAASAAVHVGLTAETASEAYFLLLGGRSPLLCGRPQVQRQDAREQSAARFGTDDLHLLVKPVTLSGGESEPGLDGPLDRERFLMDRNP